MALSSPMFEYLRYIYNVTKKPFYIWIFAPGLYMMILPFAFSGGTMQDMTETKKIMMDDTLGKNELVQSIMGIKDWEKIWTLEGLVTSYIFNLFLPLLIAIATLVIINKITTKAEEDGTYEFVASLPFSRISLGIYHSFVVILFGLILGQVWSLFIYIPQLFLYSKMSETLVYSSLALAAFQSSLGGISFAAFGYCIGAATGKSGRLWLAGLGLLAFEWISNIVSGKIKFFEWYHNNFSSFAAYNDPYNNGLEFGDTGLVLLKIILFLALAITLFKDRSLNLR